MSAYRPTNFSFVRKENSHVKSLKKQHEAALAEIQEQRTQVRKYIEFFLIFCSLGIGLRKKREKPKNGVKK